MQTHPILLYWLLAVTGLIMAGHPTSARGSELSQTAALMQPGEWRQLATQGFNGGDILEPCLDNLKSGHIC